MDIWGSESVAGLHPGQFPYIGVSIYGGYVGSVYTFYEVYTLPVE